MRGRKSIEDHDEEFKALLATKTLAERVALMILAAEAIGPNYDSKAEDIKERHRTQQRRYYREGRRKKRNDS